MHQLVKALIAKNNIQSAHDCSEGGLFIALLESAKVRNLGFDIKSQPSGIRNDAYLFGEAQGRVVVSVKANAVLAFEAAIKEGNVSVEKLGTVTNGILSVANTTFGQISEYIQIYENALANYLA
jgi:phosphoribosylformylglycinamidine synthase